MKKFFKQLLFVCIALIGFSASAHDNSSPLVKKGLEYNNNCEYTKALQCFRKGANKGDSEARFYYGYYYENGLGIEQSFSKAAFWYEKAANKGVLSAKHNLALLFVDGKGVKKNQPYAVKLMTECANANLPISQYMLGVFYENGEGVNQSIPIAAKWYEKAARNGHIDAQRTLATLHYLYGDKEMAKYWITIAAQNGDEAAIELYPTITNTVLESLFQDSENK